MHLDQVTEPTQLFGRAIRLILLNVGGGRAPDLDKCTLGNPAKYTYCICENEQNSPFAPYHVEKGFSPEASTVFTIAAEAPHSVPTINVMIRKGSLILSVRL